MAFKSLAHFVRSLEENRELLRISGFVSPRLEITEIADRMVKNGGKALLFENTGTDFPLLINMFASDRRICMALGVNSLDDIERDIASLLKEFLGPKKGFMEKLMILPSLKEVVSWMPKSSNHRGACQEVVMEKPDLSRLPVPTCWPFDGGPFITLPGVHTKDPDSGVRNLGMYRMQVFSPDMTGMHWHLHKGSASHFNRYKELGARMPVTVTLGGDPVYTYAATAPLPENLDEYLLAGFLRKKKVTLVRCLTNDLEVPADVDFVIEGYVDPGEELILEGPFGDHTGFYSLADYFPRFHVTCISHRKNAIFPATIVGIPPQEDGWIGKATERIFLMPIKMTVTPEVTNMHMPVEGVFHNITLVSIKKHYPGQALKVMNALWGAGQMMFNKIMAVTDATVVLTDYLELARALGKTMTLIENKMIRGSFRSRQPQWDPGNERLKIPGLLYNTADRHMREKGSHLSLKARSPQCILKISLERKKRSRLFLDAEPDDVRFFKIRESSDTCQAQIERSKQGGGLLHGNVYRIDLARRDGPEKMKRQMNLR